MASCSVWGTCATVLQFFRKCQVTGNIPKSYSENMYFETESVFCHKKASVRAIDIEVALIGADSVTLS
jgi:hypothetical protein